MKCLNCEKSLPQTPGKRAKQFCDVKCRSKYWQKQAKLPKVGKKELESLIEDIKPAIEVPKIEEMVFGTRRGDYSIKENWVIGNDGVKRQLAPYKDIDDYCEDEAITPMELIEQHKSFKKALNARKTSENEPKQHNTGTSNWFTNYASRKSQGTKTEK